MKSRPAAFVALAVLAVATVALQAERNRRYTQTSEDARLLYLQSGDVARRVALE
jgi:hypothetical protein